MIHLEFFKVKLLANGLNLTQPSSQLHNKEKNIIAFYSAKIRCKNTQEQMKKIFWLTLLLWQLLIVGGARGHRGQLGECAGGGL